VRGGVSHTALASRRATIQKRGKRKEKRVSHRIPPATPAETRTGSSFLRKRPSCCRAAPGQDRSPFGERHYLSSPPGSQIPMSGNSVCVSSGVFFCCGLWPEHDPHQLMQRGHGYLQHTLQRLLVALRTREPRHLVPRLTVENGLARLTVENGLEGKVNSPQTPTARSGGGCSR